MRVLKEAEGGEEAFVSGMRHAIETAATEEDASRLIEGGLHALYIPMLRAGMFDKLHDYPFVREFCGLYRDQLAQQLGSLHAGFQADGKGNVEILLQHTARLQALQKLAESRYKPDGLEAVLELARQSAMSGARYATDLLHIFSRMPATSLQTDQAVKDYIKLIGYLDSIIPQLPEVIRTDFEQRLSTAVGDFEQLTGGKIDGLRSSKKAES